MENARGRIAVIGGGASGCMAAATAAHAGCHVTIFEKNEKIAKKIYATGNGRCNLTNLFLDESCYHNQESRLFAESAGQPSSRDICRVLSLIGQFSQKDLIRFFREAGVPVHDRDGYVYPRTDQAETVARALEKCLRRENVRTLTECNVLRIEKAAAGKGREDSTGFRVYYSLISNEEKTSPGPARDRSPDPKDRGRKAAKQGGKNSKRRGEASKSTEKYTPATGEASLPAQEAFYDCDAVILCTGGLAGPSFGCSGDGYRFAEHFAHSVIAPLPALTRLDCDGTFLRRAAGVRCHASVALVEDGEIESIDPAFSEDGELQITEKSISGIPVFQISGRAARLLAEGRRVRVVIDFLPEFSRREFEKEIEDRLRQDRGQMLGDFLLGLVHRKVIDMVLAKQGLQAEMKARRFSDEELAAIMSKLRSFELDVTGTGGFDHAQVTSGGVPLSEVEDSLASLKCTGLFLAGELLDVDGRCGGYNLQWAMTSGVLAGRAAAVHARQSGK